MTLTETLVDNLVLSARAKIVELATKAAKKHSYGGDLNCMCVVTSLIAYEEILCEYSFDEDVPNCIDEDELNTVYQIIKKLIYEN